MLHGASILIKTAAATAGGVHMGLMVANCHQKTMHLPYVHKYIHN